MSFSILTMGKNSTASKQALRRKQKLKKIKAQLEQSSDSPPSQLHILSESNDDSLVSTESTSQQDKEQAMFELVGVDKEAFEYKMDDVYGFPVDVDSERKLNGEELVEHIKQANRKLVMKVKHYRKKYEQLEDRMFEEKKANKDKICSIRGFYRDMLCYGYSRGAVMVAACNNKARK